MGKIQRAIGRAKAAYRALTMEDFAQYRNITGPPVAAGVAVNQATAKSISAYMCGLSVISGDVGVVDRSLEELAGSDRYPEAATTHPTYKVIHDSPNDWMIPQIFWQTITAHALGWGMGFAEIEWDQSLRPIAMWLLTPDRVQPKVETIVDARGRKSGRLWYLVDGKDVVQQEDMFVLPGLGFDGIRGYSVVEIARQSMGLSIATERFGASFFGNGGWPGVVLQHPEEMSEEAQKRFQANTADFHQGPDRAHRWLILEEGMTISKPITIPPDDAQFLETRNFQVEEIARWLNIPVFKLHHKEGERPGGNMEAGQIDYKQSTLMPWTTRIEQEIMRKLMPKSARGKYRVVHDFNKLLVADITARTSAQKIWLEAGVIDAAHVARMESLPKPKPKELPAPAPPPIDKPADTPPAAEPPPARAIDPAVLDAHRAGVLDRTSQYVRREAGRVRQAAEKAPAELEAWSEDFYRRETVVLVAALTPLMRMSLALAGSTDDPEAVAAGEARAYLEWSKDDLLSLRVKDRTFEAEKMTQRWEATRALALTERVMALANRTKEERPNA